MNELPPTIETDRLYLRPMHADDFHALLEIFTDPQVMASFDSESFTPAQMQQWLQRNLAHQTQFGYGLFSVIEKATGCFGLSSAVLSCQSC